MFGRTSRSAPEAVEPTAAPANKGGKGRPTPKRREAERGRRRSVAAPRDRKEAYRLAREQQKEQRTRMAQGLKAGNESLLPARDRGPVRKYARDLVDTRRSVAEYFLPLALIILVLTTFGTERSKALGSGLYLVLAALLLVDSVILARQLKKGLRRSHAGENTKGVVPYALMRSMQIRRFRLPPARPRAGRRR